MRADVAVWIDVNKMAISAPDQQILAVESVDSDRAVMADTLEKEETCDALYLFACHVECCVNRSPVEYGELLAAINDHDANIRALAEELLSRSSSTTAD
jgi:hypothetical protein